MTNSKAKKKRLAKLREEGKDVAIRRGGDVPFSMHERVTKTKQETIDKKFTKYKKHFQE